MIEKIKSIFVFNPLDPPTWFYRTAVTLIILMFFSMLGVLLGQSSPITEPTFPVDPSGTSLTNAYMAILAALQIIWGWIAVGFKIDKRLNNKYFTVLSGGIVIAMAFVRYGLTEPIQAIISLLMSNGIFDLFKNGAKVTMANTEKAENILNQNPTMGSGSSINT